MANRPVVSMGVKRHGFIMYTLDSESLQLNWKCKLGQLSLYVLCRWAMGISLIVEAERLEFSIL